MQLDQCDRCDRTGYALVTEHGPRHVWFDILRMPAKCIWENWGKQAAPDACEKQSTGHATANKNAAAKTKACFSPQDLVKHGRLECKT